MTYFTVVWSKDALDGLANIWLQANDRLAVTKAVRLIDSNLSHEPASKGDELHEGLLTLIAPPFRVYYEVETKDRLARVLAVALL